MNELEEMRVLLKAAIEAERQEQKARHRALGLDASDIRAFSTMHAAQQRDKVTLPTAPVARTAEEIASARGWTEPRPLKPPDGIAIIDRMVEADTTRQRIERLLKELELLQRAQATTKTAEAAAVTRQSAGTASRTVEPKPVVGGARTVGSNERE
jgi:hypothetical protein